MLSIIIPTKNNTTELFKCIKSIHEYTHIDYKLFIADTGSSIDIIKDTSSFLETFVNLNYELILFDYYNFAKINNSMINNFIPSDVFDTICFCNNDIQLMNDGIIDRMYEIVDKNRKNIGTVGCRLLYPDNTIQHDGQKFILPQTPKDYVYLTHNLQHEKHIDNTRPTAPIINGNTFALALTPRLLFDTIGGLNEEYNECFEDVEYCMNCNLLGKANVIIESDLWAYHHESLTRGKSEESMKKIRIDYNKIRFFVLKNIRDGVWN